MTDKDTLYNYLKQHPSLWHNPVDIAEKLPLSGAGEKWDAKKVKDANHHLYQEDKVRYGNNRDMIRCSSPGEQITEHDRGFWTPAVKTAFQRVFDQGGVRVLVSSLDKDKQVADSLCKRLCTIQAAFLDPRGKRTSLSLMPYLRPEADTGLDVVSASGTVSASTPEPIVFSTNDKVMVPFPADLAKDLAIWPGTLEEQLIEATRALLHVKHAAKARQFAPEQPAV